MTPLVSITMPVYNGLPLIKASIESILKQNYSNWECVIVDDGSTDGTSDYLDTIDDPRFFIFHLEKNSGRATARQKALELAKGEYIGMLDAEDLMHPDKIIRQVEVLQKHPECSLVTTAMCSFGMKTDKLLVRGHQFSEVITFNGSNFPTHAPSLYRAEIAKQCAYNPYLRLGEDQDFLEKYLAINPKFIALSEVYYYYSELDSVTKEKIRKNYRLYIHKYLGEKNYRRSFLFMLKYIYSIFVFPFVSIDTLLDKRGVPANKQQRDDFDEFCKPILSEIAKGNILFNNNCMLLFRVHKALTEI